jgi:metal-dependent amidase/aminoacylase/carboxypeptidase family protein
VAARCCHVSGSPVAYFRASPRVARKFEHPVQAFIMQIPHLINLLHGEMTAWCRDIHAHPELGFEEHRTSEFVAGKLAEFGCEVHRNIGKTGVVGVLRTGNGPSIGLRADMDALPILRSNVPRSFGPRVTMT